jgi:hypothetical protein
MGDLNVCIESKLCEVKVPLTFSGTVGFPPPGEGRYRISHGVQSQPREDENGTESHKLPLAEIIT